MFKVFKVIIPILFLFFTLGSVGATEEKINLYFFYGDGCPHCEKEKVFLDKLKEEEGSSIEIFTFEAWNDRDNAKLLVDVAERVGVEVRGVPFLVIGDKSLTGFYNENITGRKIRGIIDDYKVNSCSDVVAQLFNPQDDDNDFCVENCGEDQVCIDYCHENGECPDDCGCNAEPILNNEVEKIAIPFLGEVDPKTFSLPILTVIIAAIDGFNPCAMWILLFLISLLLGMHDKKRMWILGGAFIMTSAFVYFLFLAAWLKMFMFLGMVWWVRLAIAGVAVVGGVHHVQKFINKKEGCEVTGNEKRKKIFDKLRVVATEKRFWLALLGIIVLAFAVNLVELVCSAGLPAMYTQVLSMSNLSIWQYYGYLALYILIFMLDDLLVFFIAMSTLQMKAISSKYTKYSSLFGGIIMIIIGLLLVFKPGWLMFG